MKVDSKGGGAEAAGVEVAKVEVKGSCGDKGRWYPGTIAKSTGRTICSDSAMDVRVCKESSGRDGNGGGGSGSSNRMGRPLHEQSSLQWRSFFFKTMHANAPLLHNNRCVAI